MGRQTNAAVGAVGAGMVSAGFGAAYLAQKFFLNMNSPQRHHHHYESPTVASSNPYASIYIPTIGPSAFLPKQRNQAARNAYGYGHK